MLRALRRILLILCAVSFVSGNIVSIAAPSAGSGEPCTHEHSGGAQHHHDGVDVCCLAACMAAPGLPPQAFTVAAPRRVGLVSYWSKSAILTTRTLAPDPAPPRSWI
jgi:hypothetical protein